MRALFIVTTLLSTFANHAIAHSPECEHRIEQFEQILAEIGAKNKLLLDFSESDAYNDKDDPAYIRIDVLEFLDSLAIGEHLRLIHSVNDVANCIHDNSHIH